MDGTVLCAKDGVVVHSGLNRAQFKKMKKMTDILYGILCLFLTEQQIEKSAYKEVENDY